MVRRILSVCKTGAGAWRWLALASVLALSGCQAQDGQMQTFVSDFVRQVLAASVL